MIDARTTRLTPYGQDQRPIVVDALVADAEVRAAAAEESAASGRPIETVLEDVREYAKEIVPRYNARLYHRLAYSAARRLATLIFRVRVGYVDQALLREVPTDASVVFVINHRSNMDYVLVAFLAAEYVALSFAVGEWARVWPLDSLVRSLGAFFVRRGSNNPLYRKVLERYVQLAVEHGVTQGVFPEGGLSKDGRLGPPKLGLLSYVTRRFSLDAPRDLVFVPVAVNYDRVLEDRTQLAGLTPSAARPSKARTAASAAVWLLKNASLYVRGRFHRFGYACISFGAPISLRRYLVERGLDMPALSESERVAETERLATLLMDEIAAIVPVTPVSLVATALLSFDDGAASEAALAARLAALVEELGSLSAHLYVPRHDESYLLEVGLRMLTLRRLVVRRSGVYRVVPAERPLVAYYANSIAHFFATRTEGRNETPAREGRSSHDKAVILVHGLARTSRSMSRMAHALENAGYEVYNWDYPSRQFGVLALVDAIAAYSREVAPRHARVDFVTHSMGGLLVRGMLARDSLPNVGRVVMLAPPNQGAEIASRANQYAWARGLFGSALRDLSRDEPNNAVSQLGFPSCPFGILAGTRSFNPLQPASYYSSLVEPAGSNDGTVRVDETRLSGMTDFATVNANHTFIMDHEETIRQTLRFLECGQFDHSQQDLEAPEFDSRRPGR